MEDRVKLRTVPKYGDRGTGDVAKLQHALGVVTEDDWFGKGTLKALQKLQKAKGLKGTGVIPANGGKTFEILGLFLEPPQEDEITIPPSDFDNFFGAIYVGYDLDLLGKKETDPELNSRLVPEWPKEGLPGYKSLMGNSRPWCAVRVGYALRRAGLKGTDSAGASSYSKWGRQGDFWFGAVLPIKHKSGGRHVCIFLYWHDEAKRIAVTLDGNRDNTFGVFLTDLSGKGDTLVGGPRWSKELPDGIKATKEQVLAKYPFFKPGSKGTSATTTK